MDILVFGGTRFFGLEIVKHLLDDNHHVTIANRGKTPDPFGDKVSRLIIDRHDVVSLQRVLRGSCFNAVIDNFAYSSNDVRRILELVNCDWYILTSTCGVYSSYDTKITEEAFDPFCHELIWGTVTGANMVSLGNLTMMRESARLKLPLFKNSPKSKARSLDFL